MDSDLYQQSHSHYFHGHQQQNNHQKPMGSGLTRYQSAPSSYFSTFLDRELCEEFLNRPSGPETESFFARFLANSGGNTESLPSQNFLPIKQGSPVREAEQQGQGNTGLFQQQGNFNSSASTQGYYQNQSRTPSPPHPPPPFQDQNSGSGIDYRVVTSMGMESLPQTKVGIGDSGGGVGNSNNNSNLVRHSSSPAGFFANISIGIENGYPVMRCMGDYGAGNNDTSYSAAGRPPQPSSGRMSPIAEIGRKNMGENSPENVGGFGEGRREKYVNGFPIAWDDSAIMQGGDEGFTDDDRTFSGLNESENQGGELGNPPRMLAHHLSLQKTSAEMAALEKILQLQDSVPCKIRAKRGCATHPRSIAERVRRTRISERMRKLQDLVPNMEKQTNTADMLDLAVDYIKDLQRQVKTLSEKRAKCMCTNMQQQ